MIIRATGALSGYGLGFWILPSYPLFVSFVSLILSGLMRSHGRTFTAGWEFLGSAAFLRVMLKHHGRKGKSNPISMILIALACFQLTVASRRY